ncbi:MAG: penicillin-binding protein 2 [Patescibacteria group bacterium]|nr:penicillin-binding protein 2 [Patescibacteria group bacterium]
MFTHHAEQYREIRYLSLIFGLAILLVVIQLFRLQILQHDYYATMALDTHEIYQKIHPARGQIYFSDSRNGDTYPAAINRAYYKIYAVPKEIKKEAVDATAQKIKTVLALPDEALEELRAKLSKADDPYEPIARKIPEEQWSQLEAAKLTGIYATTEIYRYYPEGASSAGALGFCAFDQEDNLAGKYGVEGYWNKTLAGKTGFFSGERAEGGGWISLAGLTSVEAENGADLVLTIDRAIQYKACSRLAEGLKAFNAQSASLVMMDPATGAIIAMCSLPGYDPNNFSEVKNMEAFNNTAIFTPYEPGSVFKPIVMSSVLDQGLVSPNTTFSDPCERQFGKYTIHNALGKCYGPRVTMTEVLENSINTGMIWVSEKMPQETMKSYIEKFGFGQQTGVPLDTEMPGNISSLEKKSVLSTAQASFGQGITVTPLQLAVAYSALANGGQVLKPYLIKEIRYSNGKVEKTDPTVVAQAISPRASKLITGMLTSVVEKTYRATVKMGGYYVAGKTGTAQIPGPGGYTEETNHTFCGYAPTGSDIKFVMVVKFEKPERQWAESTAAVVFKDVADFALKYYNIQKDK